MSSDDDSDEVDADEFDCDDIDWTEPSALERAVSSVTRGAQRGFDMLWWLLFNQHTERHNDRPIAKIRNLIVLNAVRKCAASIELYVDDDARSLVHYCIDGTRALEMTPPPKLHESLVDAFAEWTPRRNDPLLGGNRQGWCCLRIGESLHYFRLTFWRSSDGAGAVFIELFDTDDACIVDATEPPVEVRP